MFDPTKPVRTREGRPARIICTDRKVMAPAISAREFQTPQPIVALLEGPDGQERWIAGYYADGRARVGQNSDDDLVNIPERGELWINVYSKAGPVANVYTTKEQADKAAAPWRLACIRVEWEEGEGLP